MSKYPEHEKLKEVQERSQAIGEFVEDSNYVLAEYVDGRLWPARRAIRDILADWFDIDLNKLEDEKQQMLEEVRNAQA